MNVIRTGLAFLVLSLMVFPMGCDSGGSSSGGSSQEQEDEPKYVGTWKDTEDLTGGGGFDGTLFHYFDFSENELTYRRTNEDKCLFGTVDIEIKNYDEETNIMTLDIPDSNPFVGAERLESELTIEMSNDSTLTIDGRSWTESEKDGSSLSRC